MAVRQDEAIGALMQRITGFARQDGARYEARLAEYLHAASSTNLEHLTGLGCSTFEAREVSDHWRTVILPEIRRRIASDHEALVIVREVMAVLATTLMAMDTPRQHAPLQVRG